MWSYVFHYELHLNYSLFSIFLLCLSPQIYIHGAYLYVLWTILCHCWICHVIYVYFQLCIWPWYYVLELIFYESFLLYIFFGHKIKQSGQYKHDINCFIVDISIMISVYDVVTRGFTSLKWSIIWLILLHVYTIEYNIITNLISIFLLLCHIMSTYTLAGLMAGGFVWWC